MKYGVIICPKCGKARGVETARKTTTCYCGREIKLNRMKIQFQTDSPLELADTVAKVNASLKGGEPMPTQKKRKKMDPYTAISEKAKVIKDPLERMRLIAFELTALKSEFSSEDITRIASIIGRETPEDLVARLLEIGIIYEVGPGRFKSV